jgi:5-methylcytosine-specific restriction endonuclease McrA
MPKAYELPAPGEPFDTELFSLGLPCKRNHIHANGLTLRYRKSHGCILCSRIDCGERQKALSRDPHHRVKAAAYMAERRKQKGRPSRSTHGLPYRFLKDNGFANGQAAAVTALIADGWDMPQINQRLDLDTALRSIKPSPSVAQLVYNQQLDHWRHHPEERRNHNRQWSAYYYAFRYKCDPAFRRYECQRNSERKAKNRGNHTVSISSKETAARFAQFNNTCAYCGSESHLIVEHFIPRAKGGPHALGNLLPACHQCNVSKRDHEPQQWYRSQSFFSKARWRKILMTLGKAKSSVLQLPLL